MGTLISLHMEAKCHDGALLDEILRMQRCLVESCAVSMAGHMLLSSLQERQHIATTRQLASHAHIMLAHQDMCCCLYQSCAPLPDVKAAEAHLLDSSMQLAWTAKNGCVCKEACPRRHFLSDLIHHAD